MASRAEIRDRVLEIFRSNDAKKTVELYESFGMDMDLILDTIDDSDEEELEMYADELGLS